MILIANLIYQIGEGKHGRANPSEHMHCLLLLQFGRVCVCLYMAISSGQPHIGQCKSIYESYICGRIKKRLYMLYYQMIRKQECFVETITR